MKNLRVCHAHRVSIGYEVTTIYEAGPRMPRAMCDDLNEYGFYEIFAAAEQWWAIEQGLADTVEWWKPAAKPQEGA